MPDFVYNDETIEDLLKPISPDNPCGEYLFYEDIYDQIQEAMRSDDESLPVGVWEHDIKRADWQKSVELCLSTLQQRSKDLQVAAWLTRSLLQQYGLQGVSWGLTLIFRLFSNFFPDIHPRAEDIQNDKRIGLFEWIDQMLADEVKFTRISHDSVTYADILEAEHLEHLAQKDVEVLLTAEQNGKLTKDRITDSIQSTDSSFYHELHKYITETTTVLDNLQEFLDITYTIQAPTLHKSKNVLNNLSLRISIWLKERNEELSSIISKNEEQDPENGTNQGLNVIIKNRRDAYRQLEIAADFLLKVEPHSPTPYLVHRAIAWGDMPLNKVLQDILRGSENAFELLGMSVENS